MVTQRLPTPEPDTCHGVLECTSAELLALGTVVFLLFFLVAVVDLRRALSVVDAERTRLREEARALDSFASRVADLDPTQRHLTDGGPDAGTLVESGTTSQLRAVKAAYEETMMAVSHYDEEYGEPLGRNMAVEFGDDVAAAVVQNAPLTPQLQETILQRSRRGRDRRLTLADHLADESDHLSTAADRLERVQQSADRLSAEDLDGYGYDDLRAEWYLLEDRIEECEGVLDDRQDSIQGRRSLAERVDGVDTVEEYIYEPLPVTYPVLARGSSLLDALSAAQQRVAAELSTRN